MVTASLREPVATPCHGRTDFLSGSWEDLRDSGIPPLHQSDLSDDQSLRDEFLEGARLLGVVGRAKTPVPQQLRLADVINTGCQTVGVLLPRRSTKTTSVIAVALGRCATRMDYMVGFTMCTTGQKARERFRKDIANVLDRLFPDVDSRPFKVRRAAGSERIEFDTGSVFQVLVPAGDAFRGDAFDMVILDEAGEASIEMTEDLLAGILPTFDTRPGAQLVIAGTAAKFRKGNLLWDTLQKGRDGLASVGILEYAAPDDTDEALLDDWDEVERLVLAAHPGIGTLTTLDIARQRWESLTRRQFAEEYLSIFGATGAVESFVDQAAWLANAVPGEMPATTPTDTRVGFGIAVSQDLSTSCIVAAWRDGDGVGNLLMIDYRQGVDWVAVRAGDLARKYRTSVVFDEGNASSVGVVAQRLKRLKPVPRLAPQQWKDVYTAAGLFMKDNAAGMLRHWSQSELDEAVRLAVKRGSPVAKSWAFGRNPKSPGDSIIALEAASLALRWVDDNPVRRVAAPSVSLR